MNGFVLWHRDPAAQLGIASDRRVLRAAEVPALQQADALLAELQALRANEQARIDAACEAARQAGREQGLAEGQAWVREQAAQALAQLTQQHDAARQQLQQAAGRLALDIFHKLLGTLPGDAVLARLATQAARELLPARCWRIEVHPSALDALRAALQAADPDDRAGLAQAELVANPQLAETDCRLVTEFGTADASLATQVARLAQAWSTAA